MKKTSMLIAALLCIGVVHSGGSSITQSSNTIFKTEDIAQDYEVSQDLYKDQEANLNIENQQLSPEFSEDKLIVVEADCGCWRHLIECGGARPLTQCIRDYLDCLLNCDI